MTEWDTQLTEQYDDTPDAESVNLLVKHFALTLSDRVTAIFPDALGVKYVTAPALRRQVWNAVLAITDEIQDTSHFRNNLLTKSNRQLLQNAYSTVPNGYKLALSKAGPYAQSREFYGHLHNHLNNNPTDYRFLNGYDQIDERLLHIVIKLPGTLSSFKYAKFFGSPRDVERFVIACELLHQNLYSPKIWQDAAQLLDQYGRPFTIVNKKFHSLCLPQPHIQHHQLRHISTVGDLISTGKRYQNCLYDLTGQALNNEHQFYEWLDDTDPCIVSIKADRPFGFTQGAIKAKKNEDPDFLTETTIKRLLTDLGVPDRPRLARVVHYCGQIRPYQPPKSQTPCDTDDDDIGLEELMMFDEGEHPF